jgi:hypothetical protein
MTAWAEYAPGKLQRWVAEKAPHFKRGALSPVTQAAIETAEAWKTEMAADAAKHVRRLREAVKAIGPTRRGAGAQRLTQLTRAIEREEPIADEAMAMAAKVYHEAKGFWETAEKGLNVPSLNAADETGKSLAYVLHLGTSELDKFFRQVKKVVRGGGLPTGKMGALLTELMGPEGIAALQRDINVATSIGKRPIFSPFHESMIARRVFGSIDWINETAARYGYKPLFFDDIRKLAVVRLKRMLQAGYGAKFLEGMADAAERLHLAVPAELASETQKLAKLDDQLLRHLKPGSALRTRLANLRFDPECFSDVRRVFKAYIAPEINPVIAGYDRLLSWFKQVTLLPFVPYHLRNDFADAIWFNSVMQGVMPQMWDDAMTMMTKLVDQNMFPSWARKYVGTVTPHAPFSGALRQVGRAFKVFGGGFKGNTDDVIRQLKEEKLLHQVIGRSYTLGETGGWAKGMGYAGGDIGQVREAWARLAQLLHHLDQGDPLRKAVGKVTALHYDYSRFALSPFELDIPARLFFFYRWTRMNTPGSVRNMLVHWGKHTTTGKILNTWERMNEGAETELAPQWMKERAPFVVWPSRYMLTESWFPFVEPAKLLRPATTAREMLAPLPKAGVEFLAGLDLFRREPFERFPGQRKKLYGRYVPGWLYQLARYFRGATEAQRMERRVGEAETPTAKAAAAAKTALLGSRLYSIDVRREARNRYYELDRNLREMKSEFKRLTRPRPERDEADLKEALRIEAQIKRLEPELERYKIIGGVE